MEAEGVEVDAPRTVGLGEVGPVGVVGGSAMVRGLFAHENLAKERG